MPFDCSSSCSLLFYYFHTNLAVRPYKMARGLKFFIQEVEGLCYKCSENKGADPFLNFLTDFGVPIVDSVFFSITKGDSEAIGFSLFFDSIMRNFGNVSCVLKRVDASISSFVGKDIHSLSFKVLMAMRVTHLGALQGDAMWKRISSFQRQSYIPIILAMHDFKVFQIT